MKSALLSLSVLVDFLPLVSAQVGLSYTPYTTQSGCKSADDVNADFDSIYASGDYSIVRLYDTNCDAVQNVIRAIHNHGKSTRLFVGVGTNGFNNLGGETQSIIDQIKNSGGDFDWIDTVSVGNEGLGHLYDIGSIQDSIDRVKGQLHGAGYGGHVVTVNSFYLYLPQAGGDANLCNVGDYTAVNIQAFYDGNVDASDVGGFTATQHQNVVDACAGRRVVVTEAGWPSTGNNNGPSVPSPENQAAAVGQLKSYFGGDLILFSAFNEYWKSPGAFGEGQHFGFLGNSGSSGP